MDLNGIKNRALVLIGEPINLYKCSDILILHCGVSDHPKDRGVYMYQCSNVHIVASAFTNVLAGVVADHCTNNIFVNGCTFKNMLGGKPDTAGQAVQFNNFNGFGGAVCDNTIFNYPLKSNPEDCISMYQSNGTPESPIMIMSNRIRGGGPSTSGGGIMLGDKGGSYQIAQRNTLVNPGQYGVAIAGGDNNSLIDNVIYGKQQPFTNVGLYVKDYDAITNFTVKGNRVNFTNNKGQLNNAWFGFGNYQGVTYDPTLSSSLIPW